MLGLVKINRKIILQYWNKAVCKKIYSKYKGNNLVNVIALKFTCDSFFPGTSKFKLLEKKLSVFITRGANDHLKNKF